MGNAKAGGLEEIEIILMEIGEVLGALRAGEADLLRAMATIALATNPLLV